MPDKIKILYDAVSKDYDVGSFDEFQVKLQDDTKRKAFYDGVGSEYDLGDFNSFTDKVKKKVGTQPVSVVGTQTSNRGFEPFQSQADTKTPSVLTPKGKTEYQEHVNKEKDVLTSQLKSAKKAFSTVQGEDVVRDIELYQQDPEAFRFKEDNTWLGNAIKQGLLQGELANTLPIGGRVPTPEDLSLASDINYQMQRIPQSDAQKEYEKSGFGVFKNPLLGAQFLTETIASSLAALYESAKRTVPTAVATGAGAGAFFGGVGALPGAGLGMSAGLSVAGLNLSTSGDIMQSLRDSGVDITDKDALIKAFSDENKMSEIRTKALKYGVPIMAFDMASAGIAGKLIGGTAGKSVAIKIAAGLGEAGTQSVFGSAGELAGQVASGKKVDWNEVALEGIASLATDAPDVLRGALKRDKASSSNKNISTQINKLGVEYGVADAKMNLDRDLANNVISPQEYEEGIKFIEKAVVANDKIPVEVQGDNREQSIELIAKKDDILAEVQQLSEQKERADDSYHPIIDEQIKAKEKEISDINIQLQTLAKPNFDTEEQIIAEGQQAQADFEAGGDQVTYEQKMQELDDRANQLIEAPTEITEVETIKPQEDATKIRKIEQGNITEREGVTEQQQREQEDRKDQEKPISESQTTPSNRNFVSESEKINKEELSTEIDTIYPIQRNRMKSKSSVKDVVDRLLNNDKIFESIVSSIPVNVMNDLIGEKISTDDILSNKSMFRDSISSNIDKSVLRNTFDSLANSSAIIGTKLFDSISTGRYKEFNSTVKALDLNLGEIVGLLALNNNKGLTMENVYSILSKTATRTVLGDMFPILRDKELTITEFTEFLNQHNANISNISEKTSGGNRIVEGGEVKEQVVPKEKDTVTLPARIKGGTSQNFEFNEGEWKQRIGKDLVEISKNQQKQVNNAFVGENVEQEVKPTESKFKQFEDIVNESNTLDEAFERVRGIKKVAREVADAFSEKYNEGKELSPKQAFEKFYNEVKGIKPTEKAQEEVSNKTDERKTEEVKRPIEAPRIAEPSITDAFDAIEEAKRSRKTQRGKLEAGELAVKDLGDIGKKAIFIDNNFKDIVAKIKEFKNDKGESLIKIEC